MKKICFIVSNPFFVNSFLNVPINTLSKYYDIYLICNTKNKEYIKIDNLKIKKIISIKIIRKISPYYDFLAFFEICKTIRIEKFNVVHTLTPKAGLLGIMASYLMEVPNRFHTFTGQVWISKNWILKAFLIFLDRLVIKLSTQIIVDGNSQKEFLVEKKILEEDIATVFYNVSTSGIDLKKFKPDLEMREKKRIYYKISDSAIVFLYLGRINRDKGINELIESFLLLNKENSYLFLVGPDEMDIKENLTLKYNKLNIIHLPYTNQPQNILQLCDVFCFPSYREGFGYSVIQASALEKPIICSDIYGLKYTCIDNKTGLKHKVKSAKSLLEKMKYATDKPHKMKQMGINGRTYVSENFAEDKVIEKWIEFYKKFV